MSSVLGSTGKQVVHAAVISKSELERMRAASVMWTAADEAKKRQELEALQDQKQKAARERKARMLALEEAAKSKAAKSAMEIEREARKTAIRELANESMDDNLDLVKMLKTLGARAAAFTIRDEQLHEKREIAAERKRYEDRLDVLMEIDRLNELKQRELAEQERRAKRIVDREILIEQIAARQKQKLLAEEQVEQDNKEMLSLIQKYKEEDAAMKRKKDAAVVRARDEVMAANAAAIDRKKLARQRERDEEESILVYQAKKDQELRQREEDDKNKEQAMKERQARLLAAQEKTQSTQEEVDELRARRYAEERERKERDKELQDAKTKQARVCELQQAHKTQAEQRRLAAERRAKMQRDEFDRASRTAQAVLQREQAELATKAQQAREHRTALQKQIDEARAIKEQITRLKLDEGRLLKSEFAAERAKLEAIRDKMVNEMEKKGYNPRYLAEIRAADIAKLQNR